jgi:Sulfotransferase family
MMPSASERALMSPIFVGGCERSGTTLIAGLLSGHGRVTTPPEAQFFLEGLAATRQDDEYDNAAFATFVRNHWRFKLWELPATLPTELALRLARPPEVMAELARAYGAKSGKGQADRWVDHAPVNISYALTLLTEFDTAPMIHIVRDPRAVVASVLPLDWGPSSPRVGARWWLSRIAMGLAAEAAFPDRVVRVHYEDLVREPRRCLERICPLLGLEFESTMGATDHVHLPAYTQSQHALVGRPPDVSRIDAWRSTLAERDIAVIEGELGDMSAMLGYESLSSSPSVAPSSSAREFLLGTLRTAHQRWRHRARVRRSVKPSRPVERAPS